MGGIPACYFDGRTSRRFDVRFSVRSGIAFIEGEAERECPFDRLRVSERLRNAPRKLTFPDGAYLEILNNADFNELLAGLAVPEPFVVRLQTSWRGVLAAVALVGAVLAGGYFYALPVASRAIAAILPEKVEHAIGAQSLELLDGRWLLPSELPESRK